MHASAESGRVSHDIDLFHDAQLALREASIADCAALEAAGFTVVRRGEWSPQDTFRHARVSSDGSGDFVGIDWAVDAAWRFYPPVADPIFGWRLHDIDLACNKALALGARSATRDVIDIVEWDRRFRLEAIVWAACGKDPGFNPLSLLLSMRRFARIDPGDLPQLKAERIDPREIKQRWLVAAERAEGSIVQLADLQPTLDIGVAFVDGHGAILWPDPARSLREQGLSIHRPSVGGCVPIVRPEAPPG